MKPGVNRASSSKEFGPTPEHCYILEIANDSDDEALSVARARVKPGVTTARHKLYGVAERYLIAAGHGRVEVGALKAVDVEPGDVVRIPPGISQRITNPSNDDLLIYCICTPRFSPECYEDTSAAHQGANT